MVKEIIFKHIKSLTFDAKKKDQEFQASRAAEAEFHRQLKKIARASGGLVEAHVHGPTIRNEKQMMEALRAYSKALGPWAERQAQKLLTQVMRKNTKAYQQKSKLMGTELKAGLAQTNVDMVANALMEEQVALIKSIPIEAGERAQSLAMEAVLNGTRADEIAKELMRTTKVTESRATLIARTETARANASITQARAISIGASGYIWRTTMDGAERESHAKMNGKYVKYAKVPTLDDGTTGHAGSFPNCRCWQDPVFENE